VKKEKKVKQIDNVKKRFDLLPPNSKNILSLPIFTSRLMFWGIAKAIPSGASYHIPHCG